MLSWFWKPEAPNQSVDTAGLSLKTLVKVPSLPLPSYWWVLLILGVPLLIAAILKFLSPSLYELPCVSGVLSSFYKDNSHWIYSSLSNSRLISPPYL